QAAWRVPRTRPGGSGHGSNRGRRRDRMRGECELDDAMRGGTLGHAALVLTRPVRRPSERLGAMGSSVRLGRIAGIEFGVNWSWLVFFALIVWTLASAIFPSTNPGLSKTTHIAMAVV